MRKYFSAVAALVAALLVAVVPAMGVASGSVPAVSATLRGGAEVPKGSPTGSGTARITLNKSTGKVCWTLNVKGIGKPLSSHIHKAPVGKTGPVVIPLGARFQAKGCVVAPKKAVKAVLATPGAYYVNVHTKKYLNGALRGQLRKG